MIDFIKLLPDGTVFKDGGFCINSNLNLSKFKKDIFDNNGTLPFKINSCSGHILAKRCFLKSLYNFPEEVNNIDISHNHIKTISSIKKINGNLIASNCGVESLDDFPFVAGDIDLSCNGISSVVHIQQNVNGDLDLSRNKIKYIQNGFTVTGCLNLSHNLLISPPDNCTAGIVIYEDNPCNPSDSYETNWW